MMPGAKLYQLPLLKKDLLYNGVLGVILLWFKGLGLLIDLNIFQEHYEPGYWVKFLAWKPHSSVTHRLFLIKALRRCARVQWNIFSVHKGGSSCIKWLMFCTSWHWNAGFGWRIQVLLCHNHILLHFKLHQLKRHSHFHMINNGNKSWLNNSPPKEQKLVGAFSLQIFWCALSLPFFFLEVVMVYGKIFPGKWIIKLSAVLMHDEMNTEPFN